MSIGIGGAGSRLAAKLDDTATVINVSETELAKVEAGTRILASVRTRKGQFRGSRKSPEVGRDAYRSVSRELLDLARGEMVFSSTGGGTGNGITSGLLDDLAAAAVIRPGEKTFFGLILPCPQLEPAEYINNTISFLRGPLSDAIDAGNTGNIVLFSNGPKFSSRHTEDEYNGMLADSLNTFLAIPDKNDDHRLLDGHIDHEDFTLFLSRPYFNHFTHFDFDPDQPFGEQFTQHANAFLLPPEAPIEALFLLETPDQEQGKAFYDILEHFSDLNVAPVYSVVEDPALSGPRVTVSVLYSRKPAELLDDFTKIAEEHTRTKLRKSLEQHIKLPALEVNMESEAKAVAKERGEAEEEILATLKRLGKL